MESFNTLLTVENPKTLLLQKLVNEGSGFTFEDILTSLKGRDDMFHAFLSISVDELILTHIAHANKQEPKQRAKAFSEEDRKAYKIDVLDYITAHGLNDCWGNAPIEIRTALGRGSDNQLRDILREMVEENLVTSVGITRGLRYIIPELKQDAEVAFAAYKASKQSK